MTVYNYIILSSSDGGESPTYLHKYRAIGFKPTIQKAGSIEKTLNGELDISVGQNYEVMRYVLRVPIDDDIDDADFGTWDDLIALYKLNNPSATPDNRIILTDHFGTTWSQCYFPPGSFEPEPLCTILEGVSGWMVVAIDLVMNYATLPE